MKEPISFVEKDELILVDEWNPSPEDLLFKHTKGAVILPISSMYNMTESDLDYFITSPKKSYNSPEMRNHCTHYLNYFEKFYDKDKELFVIYSHIKYLIDIEQAYNKQAFLYDIKQYILSPSMMYKIHCMNEDNYTLRLKWKRDERLTYTDKHGFLFMKISLIMNCIIPLLTHFIYIKRLPVDAFLLEVYDMVLDMFDVDIYSKLYETSSSNIENDANHRNKPLWDKQDIRGFNPTVLSQDSVINIIVNIMPKYIYSSNMICYNFNSVLKIIKYKVTGNEYEFDYFPMSSSKRDADNNSEYDKYEAFLSKQDESLYIQNKVNCEETMKFIRQQFGPFDDNEIQYYINNLSENGNIVINGFQQKLVLLLFYKYFGDVVSPKSINKEDYVVLILAAKRIFEANNMVALSLVIGSKINKIVSRRMVNAKEKVKSESSSLMEAIVQKYRNPDLINEVYEIMATIKYSEFKIIEYNNKEIDGKILDIPFDIIGEQIRQFILLI